MFDAFVGVLIGFAFGYGVREIISKRHRAAARKHFFEQQAAAEHLLLRREHIDRMKLMAASMQAVIKSKRYQKGAGPKLQLGPQPMVSRSKSAPMGTSPHILTEGNFSEFDHERDWSEKQWLA